MLQEKLKNVRARGCVCVCQSLSTKGKERCEMFVFVLKQGAAGLSLTLHTTQTVIDRYTNVIKRTC